MHFSPISATYTSVLLIQVFFFFIMHVLTPATYTPENTGKQLCLFLKVGSEQIVI